MSRDRLASDLVPAVVLCAVGFAWAESVVGLWWAAPVAVVVGAFLAVTDRFGRAEYDVGLLVLAGLGILALYAMAFIATVPSETRLAPLALGLGVGIAGRRLCVLVGPAARERPA